MTPQSRENVSPFRVTTSILSTSNLYNPPSIGLQNTIKHRTSARYPITSQWQKKHLKTRSLKKRSPAQLPQPRQPRPLATPVPPSFPILSSLLINEQSQPSCPRNEKPLQLHRRPPQRGPSPPTRRMPSRTAMVLAHTPPTPRSIPPLE
jgi:hypothetical protein